jgi:hypothetical protein
VRLFFPWWRTGVVLFGLAGSACYKVPPAVNAYAADLPKRADGQYAALDPLIQKELVLKDAGLACSIDLVKDSDRSKSKACQCTSSSGDWLVDCKDWLGTHTPQAAAPAPAPGGQE